jgi:hypothetical protein
VQMNEIETNRLESDCAHEVCVSGEGGSGLERLAGRRGRGQQRQPGGQRGVVGA